MLEYQKNVGTLEVRELVYNIIKENYDCTYELFNTCFNKTLIKINRLINSDVRILKYKQKQAKIKNIKSWGIVGLIHIINKNMK